MFDSIYFYMPIMPPKKKSKFVNKSDQERLLLKFYDNFPSVVAAIDDPTPGRKQIFFKLVKVLNLDNYDPLPVQEYSKFEYSNSSRSFQVEWETV